MANENKNAVTNENEALETAKAALDKANAEKEELLKQIEELNKAREEKEALEKEIEELRNNAKSPYKKGSFIVTAPVEDFNGEVAGVQFAYGKANVQAGWILEWFKEKGFEVEEVK